MLIAIGVGAVFGYLSPLTAQSFSLIGELFLRLLTLLIVPVIFFSMLSGVLNLRDSKSLARLGIKTFLYYFATTALAVAIGLFLVNFIAPGTGGEKPVLQASESPLAGKAIEASTTITDVLKNIIPKNIIGAAQEGNVLGLIFFSIFLGVALLQIQHDGVDVLRKGSQAAFEAIIWMIEKTMLIAPLGFFALIADLVGEFVIQGQLEQLGTSLLWYSATVVIGLLFHGIITLGSFAFLFGVNPLKLFSSMLPAITTAFSTSSSSATLPITLDCLENKAGVPNKIASFVAPLGSTVNMDGTAIYEAIAVVFIANMMMVDLTLSQQILIFLTATIAAVGAAGIPSAGLVMMVLILSTIGLPAEGVKLIVVVDRLLDMLRTATNVWGDSVGAAIIARSEERSKGQCTL